MNERGSKNKFEKGPEDNESGTKDTSKPLGLQSPLRIELLKYTVRSQ